jgi:hypothetical protein
MWPGTRRYPRFGRRKLTKCRTLASDAQGGKCDGVGIIYDVSGRHRIAAGANSPETPTGRCARRSRALDGCGSPRRHGGAAGGVRSHGGGRRGCCAGRWAGLTLQPSFIAARARSPRGNRFCVLLLPRAGTRNGRCLRQGLRVELGERAELLLVGSDDDPTGTVPGKGAGMLRRSAKSKRPGNQRRLFGTDAELARPGG